MEQENNQLQDSDVLVQQLKQAGQELGVVLFRRHLEQLYEGFKDSLVRNESEQIRGRAKLCRELLDIFS